MRKLKVLLAIAAVLIAARPVGAQTPGQVRAKQPIYTITINVVDRSTKAVNYQHRSGSTTIDFKGTPLMPSARGEAKVSHDLSRRTVVDTFDQHIGKLEARALRQSGSFGCPERGKPKERNARILACERRGAPGVLVSAADVHDGCIDQRRFEDGIEVSRRARQEHPRAATRKSRLDQRACPFAVDEQRDRLDSAPGSGRQRSHAHRLRHALRRDHLDAEDAVTISCARRSTSRAFA